MILQKKKKKIKMMNQAVMQKKRETKIKRKEKMKNQIKN